MDLQKRIFITWVTVMLSASAIIAQTRVYGKVVAQDGSGDTQTIATAIGSVPNSNRSIFVKNGTYHEKLLVTATNVRIVGESVDGVVITYDDYAGKSTSSPSTADSYTLRVEGNGFYAENLTIENTATQAQAVALYSKADTVAFKNCKFLGFQDTHYADGGRQYFLNCETRGDVDFIFGNAAAMYENSTIVCRNRKGGYVTAPSASVVTSSGTSGTNYHGIVIKNSQVLAENGLADNSCYLGRPWGPTSSSVFINCKIGSHIKPEGWSVWADNNHLSTVMAEFNNKNLQNELLDVSQRVAWSKQLTVSETELYINSTFFKGWDPTLKTTPLSAPQNVNMINKVLSWDAVTGAKGYLILVDGAAASFTTALSIDLSAKTGTSFKVKSVSKYFALSNESAEAVVLTAVPGKKADAQVEVKDGYVTVLSPCNVEFRNMTGQLEQTYSHIQTIDLGQLRKGIYLAKFVFADGNVIITKILNK